MTKLAIIAGAAAASGERLQKGFFSVIGSDTMFLSFSNEIAADCFLTRPGPPLAHTAAPDICVRLKFGSDAGDGPGLDQECHAIVRFERSRKHEKARGRAKRGKVKINRWTRAASALQRSAFSRAPLWEANRVVPGLRGSRSPWILVSADAVTPPAFPGAAVRWNLEMFRRYLAVGSLLGITSNHGLNAVNHAIDSSCRRKTAPLPAAHAFSIYSQLQRHQTLEAAHP
ncbi:uncharacterized protein V6R79_018635 [Siganus canaliculatus]